VRAYDLAGYTNGTQEAGVLRHRQQLLEPAVGPELLVLAKLSSVADSGAES
jgi:hypothetical protein